MMLTLLLATLAAASEGPEVWDPSEHPAFRADTEGVCTAYIRLAEDGSAKTINASGCEAPARDATRAGLQAWRWPAPGPSVDVDLTYAVTLTPGADADVKETEPPRVHRPPEASPVVGDARGGKSGLIAKTMAHPDAIVLVHTVPADVPEAARTLEAGTSLHCTLDVVLKGSGAPAKITPDTCPPMLVDNAVAAVKKWRWSRSHPDAPPLKGYATQVTVHVRVR